ncbi:hypothetical protein G7Y89_g10686 [Cudoniella acicularis]|uniref:Uncharacterized protein n=1 Tax=Cudoniella acicularis TaxID=354080 RepID=A0A8H4RFY1_9HELO|nr:hypothetical protein G7Y89_g10686 [Cudoniella acicularis]
MASKIAGGKTATIVLNDLGNVLNIFCAHQVRDTILVAGHRYGIEHRERKRKRRNKSFIQWFRFFYSDSPTIWVWPLNQHARYCDHLRWVTSYLSSNALPHPGIVFKPTQVWQMVFQNAGSIQCYVSDTLLMRQQWNNCHRLLTAIGQAQSWNASCKRMMNSISPTQLENLKKDFKSRNFRPENIDIEYILTKEGFFDRLCNYIAIALSRWNSLTSIFLQNVHQRHSQRHRQRLEDTLESTRVADEELERLLRKLTGDTQPNPTFTIQQPPSGKMERLTDWYAYLAELGVGVAISTVVVVVWISIGNFMHWNSNWWFIIGTYTGLVGFVDGFVLRNVYFRETNVINHHLGQLLETDTQTYCIFQDSARETSTTTKTSLGYRISRTTGAICSLPDGSSDTVYTCPKVTLADPPQVPIVNNFSFHQIMVIVSGSCMALSFLLSFYLIMRHATHYSMPKEQKQIIRIIFVIPVFAVMSFLSVAFNDAAIYLKPVGGAYEAFALAAFFLMMCAFVHEDETERQAFITASGVAKQYMSATVGVFQFPVMMLIIMIATDITVATGSYCETSNNIHFAHIW